MFWKLLYNNIISIISNFTFTLQMCPVNVKAYRNSPAGEKHTKSTEYSVFAITNVSIHFQFCIFFNCLIYISRFISCNYYCNSLFIIRINYTITTNTLILSISKQVCYCKSEQCE